MVFVFGLFLSSARLAAQDPQPDGLPTPLSEQALPVETTEVVVTLPDSQQMAMALATPELRRQALLDLAVAAHMVSQAKDGLAAGVEPDQLALAQGFLDDRAWLQALIDRYGWVQPHTSVLDPAAWRLIDELQQRGLQNMPLLMPGRMPEAALTYQVFQRAGQALALANLPNLLLEVETSVIPLWDSFLQLTQVDGVTDAAWKKVETAWFTDRPMPAAPETGATADNLQTLLELIPRTISDTVLSAVDARPPDATRLSQVRYSILTSLPQLAEVSDDGTVNQVKDALYLLGLIDGLHEARYFDFVQGLLSITFRLLEFPLAGEGSVSLVEWVVSELPVISAHYARDFAAVDPHLNTALAAIYDVLVTIAGSQATDPANHAVVSRASRAALEDAVAQLALMIPDMAYYFNTPVRAKIAGEIDACISIAGKLDEDGRSTMLRSQFDTCMETLLQLANRETRLTELSGDINGPFTDETLRRELSVVPWQRINFAIGYLEDHFTTDCLPPANVLPNPLEWAVLADVMGWLAESYPEFFETTENENRIARMRNIGEEIVKAMSEQSECMAASVSGFNDIISRIMTDYEIALRELDSGISKAVVEFRAQRLKPGADVALDKDASQQTSFRPGDLVITPCDTRNVCEMAGTLSATRALIGLFPDEYLLAEQTGMGRIEICYRNMEWVDRRSELVRADDENVANYFGRLGFDLVGRYVENEEANDIFGFRFTGSDEHHYLFAQASEEVLNDSCPVEWVGSRIITPLRENRGGIVPDRLTYLAAARKLPSRLLQSNWDRGEEWRDWFVTGIGVKELEVSPPAEILTRLNQHLTALYQAEQQAIYQRIMLQNVRNAKGDDVSLFDEMSEVTIAKAMLRTQMMLFYPESLYNSDSIRTAIAGNAGLLERRTLRRFKEDNVSMISVNKIARDRLFRFREDWSKQPEAIRRYASFPPSLTYALTRMNILYRQVFIVRPEALREIEVPLPAEDQGQPDG